MYFNHTGGEITALGYEYNTDGSVLIRYQVSGGVPKENEVTWTWDNSSFSLNPGKQEGDFTALDKVVSSILCMLIGHLNS